ncbi:MAG TPA: VOC family protein [Patescibacteria group bacterium]|nr:VOC family protein [Patescibacteria group bacterium]
MKLSGIMLGSQNAKKLADFYTKILGKPGWHDGDWFGYSAGANLIIGPHSEVKGMNDTPGRIMVAFDVTDVPKEFDRIKALGAKVIAKPYNPNKDNPDVWIATFADTDGNYFQLATPWKE